MRTLRRILACLCLAVSTTLAQQAEPPVFEVQSQGPEGKVDFDFSTGVASSDTGVVVKYGGALLLAQKVMLDRTSGDVLAEGAVRIYRDDQVWTGDRIRYNFFTRQIQSESFLTGRPPYFAGGDGLAANQTNQTYVATNTFITTDDFSIPAHRVRAKRLTIVPGKSFEARHAVLYLGNVPSFYFPYYRRNLDAASNNFSVTPGYRSRFGPYLLGNYTWFLNDQISGEIHADLYGKRGVGLGPDVHYNLGPWGGGTVKYYHINDRSPGADPAGNRFDDDRQRVWFSYLAEPATNLTFRGRVRYQTDEQVIRDFFEGEFRDNVQPNTFLEVNRLWSNWSLNLLAQPQVNDFYETVERLPDIKLTGLRQQVGVTPLFYDSESTVGYYERKFADTNLTQADFAAFRGDTYHQLTLPMNLMGWLNVSPRAGGRFTYYGEAHGPGGVTSEVQRGVFNTGAEVSFKASRLWQGVQSDFWKIDGLRHIVEPSLNYVYVPEPNRQPPELPQFDYELDSLRLLPIEFPDYNAIDSVDSQNVLRMGLRNKIQTKRDGQIDHLVNWALFTDWRIDPNAGQDTFSDLYSDIDIKPLPWLMVSSETRYDIDEALFNLADHRVTFQPGSVWSWGVGHRYLREGSLFGLGNNLLTSTLYCRLGDNWGARVTHHYEARDGRMEEQYYTLYRDLRSWTAALTFRVRESRTGGDDFTVAFTFSIKAFPRFGLGSDRVRPSSLVGS